MSRKDLDTQYGFTAIATLRHFAIILHLGSSLSRGVRDSLILPRRTHPLSSPYLGLSLQEAGALYLLVAAPRLEGRVPELEPKATFWGEPQAAFWGQPGLS